MLGSFYSEFLKYVQKEGGQDIVLTPDHIKNFMCELIDIQEDSVMLDICAGSGGFGALTFGFIESKARRNGVIPYAKSEHIKEKQIIGVEIEEDMYSLAFSNMILHGDGKSNLYKGDSLVNFEVEKNEDGKSIMLEDKIKELSPNIALMNPPYNDNAAPKFILRLCQLLKIAGNGKRTACVIAPSPCLRKLPEVTRQIFDIAKLKAVIDMSGGLFKSQNINTKTSIFIFEVGSKHSGDTYFYDLKNDGYKYSKRTNKDIGDFNQIKKKAIDHIFNLKHNPDVSYMEQIDESTFENTIYIPKREVVLTDYDFLKAIIDYKIYELQESLSDRLSCDEEGYNHEQ